MIHDGFSITEVAVRYYKARGEKFDRERSRKQFYQHLNVNTTIKIDKKLLLQIVNQIHKEQIEMINGKGK